MKSEVFRIIGDKGINIARVNYFAKWYRNSSYAMPYAIGCKFDNGKFEVLQTYTNESEMKQEFNALMRSLNNEVVVGCSCPGLGGF